MEENKNICRTSSFTKNAFIVHNSNNRRKSVAILSLASSNNSSSSDITENDTRDHRHQSRCSNPCKYLWNIQLVNIIVWTMNIIVLGIFIIFIGYFFSIQDLMDSIDNNRKTILKFTVNKAEVLSNSFSNTLYGMSSSISFYQKISNRNNITDYENVKDDLSMLLYFAIDEKSSIYHSVTAVIIGYKNGYIIGVDKRGGKIGLTNDIDGDLTLDYFSIDQETLISGSLIVNVGHFDSRERDWYITEESFNKDRDLRLSNTFMTTEVIPKLSICAVLPLYNLNDTFEGVISILFYLDDLVDIVTHPDAGEQTELIVLTNHKGVLISNSLVNETHNEIISMNESSNPMIRKIGEVFLLEYESYEELNELISKDDDVITVEFRLKNVDYICEMTAFNKNGLRLNFFYVFLKSERYKAVSNYTQSGIIVSVIFISFTIFIAFIFSCIITHPIKKMSKEIRKISKLDLSSKRRGSILDFREISAMNESMDKLKKGFINFQKFLPIEVLKYLTNSEKPIKSELWERDISVLFIDINDFTSRTESMSSEDLIILLGHFFTISERWIVNNGGIVDKFIGDCVMAFFGCPISGPTENEHHELAAVDTAFDILGGLEERNRKNEEDEDIKVKVGINSGKCLLGFIGSPNKLSFTCLGDNVNIAARLISTFHEKGSKIYIGENTYSKVKDHIKVEPKGRIKLKGKKISIDIYEAIKKSQNKTVINLSLKSI